MLMGMSIPHSKSGLFMGSVSKVKRTLRPSSLAGKMTSCSSAGVLTSLPSTATMIHPRCIPSASACWFLNTDTSLSSLPASLDRFHPSFSPTSTSTLTWCLGTYTDVRTRVARGPPPPPKPPIVWAIAVAAASASFSVSLRPAPTPPPGGAPGGGPPGGGPAGEPPGGDAACAGLPALRDGEPVLVLVLLEPLVGGALETDAPLGGGAAAAGLAGSAAAAPPPASRCCI
mmetsp:Transcript_32154/g.74236  ORF Transcript_32154/g.74236 Transcript_32154/m.74236 type:complete len:229 (-) Transcript_32154:103-789(-)